MPFDVFKLREHVVSEYESYVRSFIHILDPRIEEFVNRELKDGHLWPPAMLQLNPAFVRDQTLGALADSGVIHPETAHFFGRDLELYVHQREALDAAQRNEPYVVTTGTGSGKSLAYMVPIVDAIFNDNPARHTVRAIVVYPSLAHRSAEFGAVRPTPAGVRRVAGARRE